MKSTIKAISEWGLFIVVLAGIIYGLWKWLPKNLFSKPELDLTLIEYVNDVPEGCAWKAVSTCDYKILMECITSDDLTSTDSEGRNLLHYAMTTSAWEQSQNLCLASAAYLINIQGISPGVKDGRGLTPLHYASMTGNNLAAIYLYQKDHELIDAKDDLGFTPLNYAETYAQLGGTKYTNMIAYLKGLEGFGALVPITAYSHIYWIEGTVYSDVDEFDNAISQFDASINNCGDDMSCLLNVGWLSYWMRGAVYDKLEQYDNAIADYSSAMDIHPEEINLLYNRGKSYHNLGECESAKTDLGQYVAAIISHTDIGEIITGENSGALVLAQSMMETCVDAP